MKKTTAESDTITIRIDKSDKKRLEKLSLATDRSKSYLAAEAIHNYIELQEWQVAGIKEAIRQADAGIFADPRDVKAMFKKWKKA